MRGALMVCGTSSDAGKSTVVTGLCRLLARHGVAVAPFKGWNMSLNAMVTSDSGEIGRAQWVQSVAAGAEPEVAMNPVLLKPSGADVAQVVVLGRPAGVQPSADHPGSKAALLDVVDGALASLRARYDVVVCEGAGSPAEVNLLRDDLVNLGLARRAGIPAVLVGDIERGGVFAHLYGTVGILPAELAALVRGFVINRFRGDRALLGAATAELEDRCGVPTLGVLPYLGELGLDAEDSLALGRAAGAPPPGSACIDVAAIRLPHLSNFTDLDPLAVEPGVRLRWVDHPGALGDPDLVVLGGTRATMADLDWLRATGLADALAACRAAPSAPVVLGLCGGFQMLGAGIDDPAGVESPAPTAAGLGWLAVDTVFEPAKVTRLATVTGPGGDSVRGYEIRHGHIVAGGACTPWLDGSTVPSARDAAGDVLGTTLHGLFEADAFRSRFLAEVAARRGRAWRPSGVSFAAARERQIDAVADACEQFLDIEEVWRIVEAGTRERRPHPG
jgi:adenosylcobyric acid synthase